ncbi:SET domain-containing protein [Hypomontagnella monticulosa]|nr:SET domain-containing protein [Hypomontagnella monticulosa]
MRRGYFSLSDLPAWCTLNDVSLGDVKVAAINGQGNGLVAGKDLINEDNTAEPLNILTIPKELVLSAENVAEYAKENVYFRRLLDAAGHQSTRKDILLFLLFQRVLSSPDYEGGQGPSTPWTQYFCLLPTQVSTPTMWTELELSFLKGTSLELAVSAKLAVLAKEFDDLRENVADLPYWNEILLTDESVTISDWILLDALYRSRYLALPQFGQFMVPCLDLANHSSKATAYFDESPKGGVSLYLRKGCVVPSGSEITINYGQDKSPAEMLFSYGFIDEDSTSKKLVLPLRPLEDDPLAIPKLHAWDAQPKLELSEDENGNPCWTAPFVYLMCLNEEDGLEFRLLQETDGSRHLKVFWQDIDVTRTLSTIEDLIQDHELHQVFELRAIMVVENIIQQQLEQLEAHQDEESESEVWRAASHLISLETSVLEKSQQALDEQRSKLLQDDTVMKYLGMMVPSQTDPSAEAANEEEDFS